jgi:tripartite-type tricarboxylate transporter receptor subunit TctC
MKLPRRQFLRLTAGATALPAVSRMARAQAYPARPITMVVPYAAGGAIDTIGRILAEAMRGPIGQPIVIENVVGASGTIGVGRVARASPDGYTFVIGNWATHVLNAAMFTLQYDPQQDFAPISLVSNNPLIIVAKKSVPANDLQEFVAWLKANPGQATQGTTGAGGLSTVVGLFFQKETGTRVRFVPYRGGLAPALQDLVAGQIDFMIDNPANALPQVRAGAIKAFAVTSKRRLAVASDIPTVGEAGLPDLYTLNWQATFLPKATPTDIVTKVNAAVVAALADPAVRRRLADLGQEIFPREQQTPEALAAFQGSEIEKWWPIVKAANIKAQ